MSPIPGRRKRNLERKLSLIVAFFSGCVVCSTIILYVQHHESLFPANATSLSPPKQQGQSVHSTIADSSKQIIDASAAQGQTSSVQSNSDGSIGTSGMSLSILDGVRILVAIASFNFAQLPHLEEVLDAYLDLCAAGANVHVVLHTTIPYRVAWIDLLNSRLTCHNPSPRAGFQMTISLKSPKLRLNLVDCHRTLFYDHLDDYDLFIYTEDDMRVSPKTISAYLYETERVQQLVSQQTSKTKIIASDFNVGLVRYEYNYPLSTVIDDKTRHATENVTRVYWEHTLAEGKSIFPDISLAVPQPVLGDYYVYMHNHHQGMFLATQDLLRAWKERPGCQFDVVRQRPGSKKNPSQPSEGTQRVWMSSHMLYGSRHCNVQQVLPIDTFGALTVLHLPNKNYRRVGLKGRLGARENAKHVEFSDGTETFEGADPSLLTAMEYHIELRRTYPSKPSSPYKGIQMVNDIGDDQLYPRAKQLEHQKIVDERMDAFQDYVSRGGVLSP
eukprot:CAMPEP_0198297130 /NCGR_PEP_ID=MMETSP1449-20131203/35584_1 /TAXON_ID=420275 /ORGANISM="Attheya septentrionalis, Strain CCMP2084" /LENGTH=498 /DNA_ID=CAMNT_0043997969 /DNA_START=168 /DNA_END=1660 /DNA_ORIENTATION=-